NVLYLAFIFSSRRRHTMSKRDWSSDVCSSDLVLHYWKDESSSQRETLTDAVHYPVQCCPHRAAESWKPSCRRVPEDRHRLKAAAWWQKRIPANIMQSRWSRCRFS